MVPVPDPDSRDEVVAAWQAAERTPVLVSDDPHVWRMLAAAWLRGTVEFRYRAGSMPGQTRRVMPSAVFTVAGSHGFYAKGFCHLRAARRVFRLDRVEWPSD